MNWTYDNVKKCYIFQQGGTVRLTKEETLRNRTRNMERQRILKENGYDVQEGQPWGPWQQKQWEEYIRTVPIKRTHEDQDIFTKELDQWIKLNPVSSGITTKDFRDFLINLARTESSFKKDARNGSHYGYFQIKGLNKNADQFAAAFRHMNGLFRGNITKDDIVRASTLGITQGELLAKYWNQQNFVTNYLHRGIDHADRERTLVSQYHNNSTSSIDFSKYVPEAIHSQSQIATGPISYARAVERARNPKITYNDRQGYIDSINTVRRGFKWDRENRTWNAEDLKKGEEFYLY